MIKAGATLRIPVHLNLEKPYDSVIFTMESDNDKVTKTLTEDVNGVFILDFTQQETLKLKGHMRMEAQINYSDLSVAKTGIENRYINDTLATQLIQGNAPTDDDVDIILDIIKGDVALIITPESSQALITAVTAIFNATKAEADEVYTAYRNGELKGDKGDKGDDGYTPVRGTDYWTPEDVASMEADVERDLGQSFVPLTRKVANLPLSNDITATELSDKIAILEKTWQNLMENNSGVRYLYTNIYSKSQVDTLLNGKADKPLATVEETPTNCYVNVGDVLTFQVISYTTATLYYQWQVSTNGTTWSDIEGATSTSYQYTVANEDDGKQFRCVISTGSAYNIAQGGFYKINIAEYPVEDVRVNGSSVVSGGVADVTVPTKTSDLNNDSGFITNYGDLTDKPSINSVTLSGNKTASDLDLVPDTRTLGRLSLEANVSNYDFAGAIITSIVTDSGSQMLELIARLNDFYLAKTSTGASVAMSIDSSTYVLTLSLKNSAGTVLNTQTVDLPLESVVVNGTYDSTNKKIVLTLENGNTIDVPVGDLVSGLQSEITSQNKLASDLVDDTNQTNKFVTTSEKNAWDAKQDALIAGSNITIASDGKTISATDTTYSNATTQTAGLMSATDKSKLDGVASGAEVNVQADWNETNSSSDAYIQNKPTIPTVPVTDVQVNSTSVLSGGVANIPMATLNSLGVVKPKRDGGTDINQSGEIIIHESSDEQIQGSTGNRRPICPDKQHQSVFYGLAKASGDTTQAIADTSLYPVGTYTDDAKEAIQQMIGILSSEGVGF